MVSAVAAGGAAAGAGVADAVITDGGADGSMVRTSTMAVPLRSMSSFAAAE